jgi:LacI family transcriptional regulator
VNLSEPVLKKGCVSISVLGFLIETGAFFMSFPKDSHPLRMTKMTFLSRWVMVDVLKKRCHNFFMVRSRQVAVIIDATRPYHRKILLGVASYVHEVGNWSLYVEEEPLDKLPDLRTWHGDGMLMTFVNRSVGEAVAGLKIPMVGIEGGFGWYDPASKIPYFATDNAAVGRLGAEHLIEQGFRRLAYCGFPFSRLNSWSLERANGFQQRARKSDVYCSLFTSRYGSARKWPELQEELVVWLKSLEKPVGILAANDVRARHLLEACRTAGLRVPEDVAVLGVDNDEVMCELTIPPLSSIEQGARSLGYQAAALLDSRMGGKQMRTLRHLVEPKGVVMRRSTNILAIDDPEVATAVTFIRDHACDPILVRDVLAAIGVSRSTLDPRFKAVIGRTIHAEIQRVQIEQARRLIATTELPLKQIATMAGFSNVHYMTTIFHEHTGWTPAEYRKHARL